MNLSIWYAYGGDDYGNNYKKKAAISQRFFMAFCALSSAKGMDIKMNIHKDKMLWYNTKYCIRTSDERSWNMGKDLKGKELGLWISTWLSFDMLVNQRFSYWTGIKSKDL